MTKDFVLEQEALGWFSKEMEKELQYNSYKRSWELDRPRTYVRKLFEEIGELVEALTVYEGRDELLHSDDVISEAADVANIAMMIADLVSKRSGGRKFLTVERDQVYGLS